ncbi:16S rRNA (uracil(1498)-N(3))-methyltransferase [Adhaeribacter aquaticus]|uniref:16S rRNA (uracil(1498)-N(3))-methyltransferase n=1 Tax=Adhaeribacter aquaticus TaxID=299567 RepID=UPI00040BF917|nr:16S rRNA (uracil(1498)-N(3))-methyltransferase [Adhaeribacter aquaticus]
MHLFYTPQIANNTVLLTEEESKHALRVLRLQAGDEVQLVDGEGGYYKATISEANPKKCLLQIKETQKDFGYRPYRVKVAVAPTKNIDRMEWFVEKATEIGIDEIYFLNCERSERKNINLDRLEKIVVSAMKQSLKAYKPVLHNMIPFKEFVKQPTADQLFIAHLEEHNQVALSTIKPDKSTCILIGPEGDFSPNEIELAYKQNIKPVTLGTSRLRTETAALVACHTVNLLHEMNLA